MRDHPLDRYSVESPRFDLEAIAELSACESVSILTDRDCLCLGRHLQFLAEKSDCGPLVLELDDLISDEISRRRDGDGLKEAEFYRTSIHAMPMPDLLKAMRTILTLKTMGSVFEISEGAQSFLFGLGIHIVNALEHAKTNPILSETIGEDELCSIFGVRHTTLRKWAKDGSFPRPIKLSKKCYRWNRLEVDAAMATRQDLHETNFATVEPDAD